MRNIEKKNVSHYHWYQEQFSRRNMFRIGWIGIFHTLQINHCQNQWAWCWTKIADRSIVQAIEWIARVRVRKWISYVVRQWNRHLWFGTTIVERFLNAIQKCIMWYKLKIREGNRKFNLLCESHKCYTRFWNLSLRFFCVHSKSCYHHSKGHLRRLYWFQRANTLRSYGKWCLVKANIQDNNRKQKLRFHFIWSVSIVPNLPNRTPYTVHIHKCSAHIRVTVFHSVCDFKRFLSRTLYLSISLNRSVSISFISIENKLPAARSIGMIIYSALDKQTLTHTHSHNHERARSRDQIHTLPLFSFSLAPVWWSLMSSSEI